MKIAGIIFLVVAAGNFVVFLYAAGQGWAEAAGQKLTGVVLLSVIGGLLYYFGDKKKEKLHTNDTLEENQVYSEKSIYNNSEYLNVVQSITKREIKSLSEKDRRETIESVRRWAKNLKCEIKDIRKSFLRELYSTFSKSDMDTIIAIIKTTKMPEEAKFYKISEENTCCSFMLEWLEEEKRTMEQARHKETGVQLKNKMTAADLVRLHNAPIEFLENPKTGKLFFRCKDIKGYVSPAAKKAVLEDCSIDDLQYAEVSTDGSQFLPCLMLKQKRNVVKILDVDDRDLPF